MFRPRLIPVILVDDSSHAVKTVGFRAPLDLGDPVNIVSLFNSFKVDELVVLDIAATRNNRSFPLQLMSDIASEAQMPLSVGGGIQTLNDIHALLHAGAEKVIISTAAIANPGFVREASNEFASSSITVCIDAGRDWLGRYRVQTPKQGGKALAPADLAIMMEDMGAGELIIQSKDQDGRMGGYDIVLTTQVADAVGIPVVALGGAGDFADVGTANSETCASAFASGSLFCFQDRNRGVLISYPDRDALASLTRPS